jgi:hypothetical protein
MSLRAAQMFELDAEDHHSRLTAAFSANRRNSDLARAVSRLSSGISLRFARHLA